MNVRDIDLDLDDTNKNEQRNMLYYEEDFQPVQKNEKMFKFILFSTKLEMKYNSLISMIYTNCVTDFLLWVICIILFIFSPENFFLAWILTIHLAKGVIGMLVLQKIPLTYEVIEKLSKQPDLDESNLNDTIYSELKNFFMARWAENKCYLLTYFILNILSIVIDLICVIVHLVRFPDANEREYQAVMTLVNFLFLCKLRYYILLYFIYFLIVFDLVYFLWLVTLKFTLPEYITSPIKSAILGMVNDMIIMVKLMLPKKNEENRNNIENIIPNL